MGGDVRGQHALSSPHCSTMPPALHPHSHIRLQPRQPSPTTYEPVRMSRGPLAHLREPSKSSDDPRGPSMTIDVPSINIDPPRGPSIPLGARRVYIEPSRRPRTIPQYLGNRPLPRRFPIAGSRTLFGSFVMLVADCVQYRLHWDAG